jgi:hypothetical protein
MSWFAWEYFRAITALRLMPSWASSSHLLNLSSEVSRSLRRASSTGCGALSVSKLIAGYFNEMDGHLIVVE